MNVGQFCNRSPLLICWYLQLWNSSNRFPVACTLNIKFCFSLKLVLPVTVSICNFLPSSTNRKENIVVCCFIMKLNMKNRCTCKWMTSARMEYYRDRMPAKNLQVLLWSLKGIDGAVFFLICVYLFFHKNIPMAPVKQLHIFSFTCWIFKNYAVISGATGSKFYLKRRTLGDSKCLYCGIGVKPGFSGTKWTIRNIEVFIL